MDELDNSEQARDKYTLATKSAKANEIAERIRHAIEHKVITIQGQSLQITASFGIAELTEQQDSFNQLFNSADRPYIKQKTKAETKW